MSRAKSLMILALTNGCLSQLGHIIDNDDGSFAQSVHTIK